MDLSLYAAVDPTDGESYCLYLPGMDRVGACRVSSKGSPKPILTIICSFCARWRPEPSLRGDRVARERELLKVAGLLSGVEPGREVVFGVQKRALQQDL